MPATQTDNGALVLVVDDDARARELMRIILRHAGYRVLAVAEATAAVALLAVERPAVILADLLMPGMTGIEFCRWVRANPALAAVRFVLLTGMDTGETQQDARQAGADAVVTKPFDRQALLARLAGLIGPVAGPGAGEPA
ncbi:MAG: response regulator [Steroidobacteraceae bacterium]